MACQDKVKDFLVSNFLFGDGIDIKNNTSFLEKGIIDSTGILELVMFLEETYHIHIEDNELIPENLDTLDNIDGFISQKRLLLYEDATRSA